MRRSPTSSSRSLRVVAALAALCAVALVSGAITDDSQRIEARRRRIEGMTQSELNQLRRNYEIYLKMPPARRAELARLNDEIEQDTRMGGHLQLVLDSYNRWFSDLSPFDRARILNTAEPIERAILVQKLLQEQKQRQTARAGRLRTMLARADFGAASQAALSPKDLDSVITAVRDHFLSQETKQGLQTTADARERHLEILKAAMLQLRQHRGTTMTRAHELTNLVNIMVGAISDEAVRERITRRTKPQEVRRVLGQIVARALLAEWKTEVAAALPADTEIDQIVRDELKAADPQKRDTMMRNLKTPAGRRRAGIEIALETSPKLDKVRPIIIWLHRGMRPFNP